ncbi:MAG: hypothetical protein EDQ89_00225 [Acidobacteria bacterium]|nr:MAG: hypothetical protein EDQ89_00225 [Acidobacteriota bacterium]
MTAAAAYRRYLRAARLKSADAEAIFATAKSELTARRLAELVAVLREHHGFKLRKVDRDALIDELLDLDLAPTKIAMIIGCHWRTVTRRAAPQVGVTEGLDKRCQRDKTAAREPMPILRFHAAGGGDDERLIRKMLRGEAP